VISVKNQVKVNLNFILEIIDASIGGLERDLNQQQITLEQYNAKVEVLEQVKGSIKSFVREANSL
jgi:hypothetical protein